MYGGTGCGHLNSGSHSQTGHGGATFYGGGGGTTRHNPGSANSFSIGPGAGASGNEGQDGTVGSTGASGLCIVYAYK